MKNKKQLTGMILGIVSFVIPGCAYFVSLITTSKVYCLCFGVGLVLAIVGLIISIMSVNQAKRLGESKGMGVVGLVLSIIGIVNNIGMIFLGLVLDTLFGTF